MQWQATLATIQCGDLSQSKPILYRVFHSHRALLCVFLPRSLSLAPMTQWPTLRASVKTSRTCTTASQAHSSPLETYGETSLMMMTTTRWQNCVCGCLGGKKKRELLVHIVFWCYFVSSSERVSFDVYYLCLYDFFFIKHWPLNVDKLILHINTRQCSHRMLYISYGFSDVYFSADDLFASIYFYKTTVQ